MFHITQEKELWYYWDCNKYVKLADIQENTIRIAVKVKFSNADKMYIKISSFLLLSPYLLLCPPYFPSL